MNRQKYQLALDYLIGQTGSNQQCAQVNGDTYLEIEWTSDIVFSNSELVDAYQIAKKYQHVWKEFIVERNRRLAETDWWALSDISTSIEQKTYRQSLRDLTDIAEPVAIDSQFDIHSVNWPTKPDQE